jgi:DNA repair exonuclease SbcCD ATPase subunit
VLVPCTGRASQERRLLFSQGVTLHVQPDGQAWRQFVMLSGGQQALATLALSFALQVGTSHATVITWQLQDLRVHLC